MNRLQQAAKLDITVNAVLADTIEPSCLLDHMCNLSNTIHAIDLGWLAHLTTFTVTQC